MKNPNNDSIKRRYKMYKAGKNWLYAPLLFLSLGAGVYMGGQAAQAATTDEDHKVAVTAPAPEANAPAGEVTLTAPSQAQEVTTPESPAVTPAPVAEQAQEMVDGRPLDQEEVDDENLVLDVTKVDTTNATQVDGLTPRTTMTASTVDELYNAVNSGATYIKLTNNLPIQGDKQAIWQNKQFTIDGSNIYSIQFFVPMGWTKGPMWQLKGNSHVTFTNLSFTFGRDNQNNERPLSSDSSNIAAYDNSSVTIDGSLRVNNLVDKASSWDLITLVYSNGSKGTLKVNDNTSVNEYVIPTDKSKKFWIGQNWSKVEIGKNVHFGVHTYTEDLKNNAPIDIKPGTLVQTYTGWINLNNQEYYQNGDNLASGIQLVKNKQGSPNVANFDTQTYLLKPGKTTAQGHGDIQFDFGQTGFLYDQLSKFQAAVATSLAYLKTDDFKDLRDANPNLLNSLQQIVDKARTDITKQNTSEWLNDWANMQKQLNQVLATVVNAQGPVKNEIRYKNATPDKRLLFDQSIAAGQELMKNVNATPTQINQVMHDIAENKLKLNGALANKDALYAEIIKKPTVHKEDKYIFASQNLKAQYDAAIEKGTQLLNDQKADQNAVNGATGAIIQAQNNLNGVKVDKGQLEAAVKAAPGNKAKDKFYNADKDKQDAYTEAVKTGEFVLNQQDATNLQITNAYNAIDSALKALNGMPTNFQELEELINAANDVKDEDKYTKATPDKKAKYDQDVAKGWQLLQDGTSGKPVSQNEVYWATEDIKNSLAALDGVAVNKEELKQLVDEAPEFKKKPAYTKASDDKKQKYDDTIKNGEQVLKNNDATQPQVEAAVKSIIRAKGELGGQDADQVNKQKLKELIKNSEAVIASPKFTKAAAEKKNAYTQAIAEGKMVDADDNAKQPAVDAAVDKIEQALAALDGAEKKDQDQDLLKAKHDAKHAIQAAEEKKNKEINGNQNLTDEEKEKLENEVTGHAEKATEKIDDAPTVEEVEKAKNEGLANIDGVTVPKKSAYKEKAKDAIIDAKDKKNKQIEDAPGLDEDKKQELTADVNEKADEAMRHIDEAPTNDMVDKAKDAGIKAIEGIQIPAPAKPDVDPGTDPKPADPSEKPEDANKELEKAKEDAKQAIDDAKKKKDAEIAKADHLKPEAKEELNKKVDDLANDAKKKIDAQKDKPAVEAEKQKGLNDINGVQVPEKPAEEQVDLTKLKKVVEEAPKNKQNHTYFNAADQLKKAYDDKVADGAKILSDADKGTKPTAQQVQDAYDAIVAAKGALDGKPTNTQELQALLAEATKVRKQPKYMLADPAKKTAYDQAQFKGVQASANPKTTPQKTVDEAVNLIKAAKAGLNGEAKDLQNKKDEAKKAIDAEKSKKDAEIDAKKLTPEVKTETKNKVQKAADEAKENINKAPTGDEVTKAKEDGIKKIQGIEIPAEPGEVDPKGPEGEEPGTKPEGEQPSVPGVPSDKPGEVDPSKPTEPQKPEGDKPANPGEKPGGEDPSKPAVPGEQPQVPGEKPGEQDPKKPESSPLDLTELAKLVDEAKDVRRTHKYFNANDDLKKAYDDKIKAGEAIKDNFLPGQTQTDVDNAVKGIKDAKAALNGPETNTDELVELLKKENPTKQSPKYKLADPDKKKNYDNAVKEGRKVNTNFTTTPQTKVDAAVQKLKDAFNALNGEAKELEKEKQDAKNAIDDAKTKKDGEFDDAGLDPESKEKKKAETKKIADEAKQKIDEAETKDDVKKAKEEGIKKIQEVVVPIKPESEKPAVPKGPEGEEPGKKPESDKPGAEKPSVPGTPSEKPGEEGPSKPTDPQKPESEKPTDPQKPGGEDPSVPGTKPEGEQPSVPGTPGDKPGTEKPMTPEVPGGQPTDPKTPEGEKPEDAAKELEKAKEDAKQAIDDAKKKKDAEIAKADHLDPEAKKELTKKVDDFANDAKKKIDEKKTKPEVEDAKQKGLDDINSVQVPEKPAEEQVDLTKLKKVVDEAPKNRKNHTYFNATETPKDNYDEKIALGDKILSDAEKGTKPTAQQVQDAYNAIVAAKGALDGKPTNTKELQDLLTEATNVQKQPKYMLADQDKKDALDQAKAKGEQANADPKKTPQAAVDEAVKDLKGAIANLNGDAKDLQNKKDDANKAIDDEKAKKDAEIDAKKLTPEAKTETKKKVQKAADEAKENINKAPTGDEVTKAKEDGIKKIQGIEIPAEPSDKPEAEKPSVPGTKPEGEKPGKKPEGDKPANPGEKPGGEDPSKPAVPGEQPTDPKGPEGEEPGKKPESDKPGAEKPSVPGTKPEGEQPSAPGAPSDKPGEVDPSKPTEPQKPEGDKPANPGEKPGGEDPSKPAVPGEQPQVPGDPQKPSDKPGEVGPSKPADPKGPEGEKPDDAAKELEKAKTDAKKEVDDAKKKKDAELDTKLDPQDAEKKKAETKKIADDTKKKIDDAQTKDDVNKAKEEGIKKIEDVVVPTKPESEKPTDPQKPGTKPEGEQPSVPGAPGEKPGEVDPSKPTDPKTPEGEVPGTKPEDAAKALEKAKEDAKKAIDDAKTKKSDEIAKADHLKPEAKEELNKKVDDLANDAKKKIDAQKDKPAVEVEKQKGLDNINGVQVPAKPEAEKPMTPEVPGGKPTDPKGPEGEEPGKKPEGDKPGAEKPSVPGAPSEKPGEVDPSKPTDPKMPEGEVPGTKPEDAAKALEKAKEDAKKAIDDEKAKKDAEIDAKKLKPEVKAETKKKVEKAADEAKENINKAPTGDEVTKAKEDGIKKIQGIEIPAEPSEKPEAEKPSVPGTKPEGEKPMTPEGQDPADDLKKAKEAAKKAIGDAELKKQKEIDDNKQLTEEEKKPHLDNLGEIAGNADDAIEKAPTKQAVEDAKNEGLKKIDDIKLPPRSAEKAKAKDEVDDAKNKKNQQISAAPGLDDAKKNELMADVNGKADDAKKKIDDATTNGDVNKAKTDGINAINGVQIPAPAMPGDKPEDPAKALEKAKTDAKKALDDAKTKKDGELDAKLDPKDAEKKKAETKKITDDTKKKIDDAKTKDEVNKAKEEGIKKIEDVVVPTKPEAEKPMTPEMPKVDDKVKEDAKKEIDDAKKKKDAEIDDSKTLKPEEKTKKKDDVKKIVDDTKKKIDDAKTNDDVKKEKEKGLTEIGKVEVPKTPMTPEMPMTPQGPQTPGENPEDPAKALEKAKTDAKKALDDAKTKKDGELDAKLDPKDAEKKKAETKKITDDTKKKIDDAKTKDEVNKAKEEGIKKIEDVVVPTKPGEMPGMPMNPQNPMTPQGPQTPGENPEDPAKALEKAKQDAKKALDDAENKKNGEIDNGNLTPEEKKNLKNKVMGIVSQTKKMIDDAKTKDQVNDAKCDGLVAINGIHVPMMPAAPAPMNPMPGAMPQTNGQQMMTTDHGMTKMAMPKTTAMQDHMQMTTDQMMANKSAMKELPQTGEEQDKALGIIGMSAAGLMTMLGIGKYASRKRKN